MYSHDTAVDTDVHATMKLNEVTTYLMLHFVCQVDELRFHNLLLIYFFFEF